MGFAKPGLTVEEQRIERDLAAFGQSAGGVVGQLVRLADDVAIEGVTAFDRTAYGFTGRRDSGRRRHCRRAGGAVIDRRRSEEHTSELQSQMRIAYADSCWNKKK